MQLFLQKGCHSASTLISIVIITHYKLRDSSALGGDLVGLFDMPLDVGSQGHRFILRSLSLSTVVFVSNFKGLIDW